MKMFNRTAEQLFGIEPHSEVDAFICLNEKGRGEIITPAFLHIVSAL